MDVLANISYRNNSHFTGISQNLFSVEPFYLWLIVVHDRDMSYALSA